MSNPDNKGFKSAPPAGRRRGGPMGGGPMMGGGEKAKDFKGAMKKLLNRLKPYRLQFIISMLFAVAGTVFSIVGPSIMRNATNAIAEGVMGKVAGTRAGIDFSYVAGILLTLVGLYFIGALFQAVQNYILVGVSQKIAFKFRQELAAKINRMPLKYFDKTPHGEVLSRVTNDVDTIGMSLSQSLSQTVSSVITVIGVLIMMLTISGTMTLVALATIPVSLLLVTNVVKMSQKYFKQQQAYLGSVNGQIEEVYAGHTIVKAFSAEESAVEKFEKDNGALFNSAWKSQFLSGIMMPAMGFVGNLGYVAVSILGGWLAIKKTIDVGDILAFIQYVRNFTQPMSQMAQIANVFQSTAAAAERVFEFLGEEEETPDAESPVSAEGIKGGVSFEHIRFGYNPDKTVIHDFSADVKQGQRIAIVGPTGAGKTTIVKLLMRYYDLESGAIRIDGHDITGFTRGDLRGLIAMVLQDTWLFNGTIRENIRYGRLDASDEEVKNAAKAAHVHHFVRTLPNGYDMVLNEEASNISQGQKQLLTIARAILSDPKILILDEATSSVDTRTEVLIQEAMETLMKGRTSFIIAHRLSTIRNADLILVMNGGDIVEQGSHLELLNRNGFYANLYNSQFDMELA